MKDYVDVRCYVTPEVKKQIKMNAIKKNVSVNRWLSQLIEKALTNTENVQTHTSKLNNELQDILFKLNNSSNLSIREREKLKHRKNEIKNMLKGV